MSCSNPERKEIVCSDIKLSVKFPLCFPHHRENVAKNISVFFASSGFGFYSIKLDIHFFLQNLGNECSNFYSFGNLPRFFFHFSTYKNSRSAKGRWRKKIICKLNNQRDDDNKWIIDQKEWAKDFGDVSIERRKFWVDHASTLSKTNKKREL